VDVLGEILVPNRIIGFGHCRRPEQYVIVDVDTDIGVQQRILGLHKRHVLETGLQVGGPQAGCLAELNAYGARKCLIHRHGRTVAVVLLLDADHGEDSMTDGEKKFKSNNTLSPQAQPTMKYFILLLL